MMCVNTNNKIFKLVPHSLAGQKLASRQMSLVDTPGNPQSLHQYLVPAVKQNTVHIIIYFNIYTKIVYNYKLSININHPTCFSNNPTSETHQCNGT
jgi:hypothetical protein